MWGDMRSRTRKDCFDYIILNLTLSLSSIYPSFPPSFTPIYQLTGECPSYDEYLFFLEIEQPALLQHISFLPIMYERWKTRRFTIRGGKQITPQLKVSTK